jgi:Gly-Xaa carboxypeptidase
LNSRLSVETLLKHGFKPKRTVVLAFGFDEEVGGARGAGTLGPYLEETYGTDGIAMIVDEGGGITEQYGAKFAAPAIGEKVTQLCISFT